MKHETKNWFIFGLIICLVVSIIFNFWGFSRLWSVEGDKSKLSESNKKSLQLVDELKQSIIDRKSATERDRKTIEALQSNIRESEENNRKSEENRQQLEETNKRLGEFEQKERERKSESNRIIEELGKGIKNLEADIEKIPIQEMD